MSVLQVQANHIQNCIYESLELRLKQKLAKETFIIYSERHCK